MPHPLPSADVDYSQKWMVMLAVSMGIFLGTIDGSIVNVALPTLRDELHTDLATVQWVVVSYLLVLTSMMLGVGRLGDMIGKKKIYMTGMAVFTGGSLLCGLAPTIGALIAFRVIQGAGAVMIQALGMGIVTEAFPSHERGRALGILGTVVSVGISVGPTLGGLLIGAVSWRAIFLVNLPVGITGVVLVRRYVPDWRPPGGQRFDRWGAALILITLLLLALGLTLGPENNWSALHISGVGDVQIGWLLAGSVVGFVAFLVAEMRVRQPMINLRLFRDSLFSISLTTGVMVFVVVAGMFVLPFYLEDVKGLNTVKVGLYMAVFPVALGVIAPIAGEMSDRFGSRGIALIGLALIAGSCVGMATLDENTTTFGYVIRMLPLGLGVGVFQSPNNSAVMGAAPRDQIGVVSGLLSLSRTFGQVVGVPVMGAVFASRIFSVTDLGTGVDATDAPPWALVEGVEALFLAAAGLVAVGVGLAILAVMLDRRQKRQEPTETETVPAS